MVEFSLNATQRALRKSAQAFARDVLAGAPSLYTQQPDQFSRFQATRPLYQAAVSGGLIKGQVPVALGGSSESLVDAALVVEELYAVEPAASLTILGTGLGLTPLILAGSSEQQEKLLKPFLSGTGDPLASFVHSEPAGTANWLEKGAAGLQTTARKVGDHWLINGEKMWSTNSGGWDDKGADLQSIVCRLVDEPNEPQSPSVDPASLILILLVTREDITSNNPEAFKIISHPELPGHTAATSPHSCFTDFRVPNKNLLAEPGKGAQVVEMTFGSSAAIVGAMSVGIMRAAFEAALKISKQDSRGGIVPIIDRQSVADLLIDIKMRIEASRLLTWKALHAIENGPRNWDARWELALEAKVFASDSAANCVMDAMKAVGIKAYDKSQPFSRLLNDAICLPLFDGGNVGIRRRQISRIFAGIEYKPWDAVYGQGEM